MKFTLSWLKEHLDTDASLDEIVERLTMTGLEVESVDDKAALKPFVIARVLTAEQHPDADRLRVLSVDTGSGDPVQVVCGAPNARAGLVGAFAAPGTYVPGIDVTLSVGTIRGVESRGMMCSERELQLSDEHDGIIDLPADAPVGTPFATWAKLDDPVIEINLTPNRPDATSVYGIARDLAASGLGRLKDGAVMPVAGEGPCPVKVSIEEPDLCPGFALRLVRGVRNGPSPKWLQQRLIAIGLRPINALVDITNYVTFDRGRPLHVFDAAKVKGDLVVRRAREGEKVLALDTREYVLTPEMCVIADVDSSNGNGLGSVESIAGIMGGEHSGCDETTTDVLIESALWNALNVARTGRELGIITDARYRFERGVDPEFMVPGLELATKLVTELCGGTPSEAEVAGYAGHTPKIVSFPFAEVKRLTGIDVPAEESRSILSRLGFEPKGDGETIEVAVPSWRPDVEGKADLVEEVMRIHGVEKIAPQPLVSHDAVNGRILTTLQIRTRDARRALAVRGMMEAVTWSFIPARHAGLFGGGQEALRLANPIAADMSDMRPSLLPGLIAAAQRNADRGFADVALFEVSGTYEGDQPDSQRRVAGGVRRGTAKMDGQGRHCRAGRRVRREGGCLRRARGLRRAGRQAAGRGGRSRLVSSGTLRDDQARPEGRARHVRRVPSEDARGARRFGPALRLRGVRRQGSGAEGQADAHQAAARHLALPGGQARLRLRGRPRGRSGDADARGGRRGQEAHHRRPRLRRVRRNVAGRRQEVGRHRGGDPARRAHADRRGLRGPGGEDRRKRRQTDGRRCDP